MWVTTNLFSSLISVVNAVASAPRRLGINDLFGMSGKLVLPFFHLPNNCASLTTYSQITPSAPRQIVNFPEIIVLMLERCCDQGNVVFESPVHSFHQNTGRIRTIRFIECD
jgi:hypothetical protein